MLKVIEKKIWKFTNTGVERDILDEVAVEKPLEIFLNGNSYITTMRLPGRDFDLVRGFLFSSGIIDGIGDVINMTYSNDSKDRVFVELRKKARETGKEKGPINFSSGCIFRNFDISKSLSQISRAKNKVPVHQFFELKEDLERRMELFSRTGCVHGVGLYSGELENIGFAEDVGRHNAFDKAVGEVLRKGKRDRVFLAMCSSRISLEMLQKGARIGVEILAGISAPTSMAVEIANGLGITLIGFLRKNRFNVYSHPSRIYIGD